MTQENGEWYFDGQRWICVTRDAGPDAPDPYGAAPPAQHSYPAYKLERPLIFYILTWLSTTWVGSFMYGTGAFASGFMFSVPLMVILTFHELGHYIQARRYRVRSTLPLFIPVPLPPFGTFGAVIKMDSQIPNIRALFDIGISGPLAGLVPTFVFLVVGIALSSVTAFTPGPGALQFGEPLVFNWISRCFFDRSIPGTDLVLHPIAMAAWTGLFITSLNLLPVGQLDGGHVFYALLKRKAAVVSTLLFFTVAFLVIMFEQWQWILMLALVYVFGIQHPPTGCDEMELGLFRKILGTLTLLFIFVGFTPNPIVESPEDETEPETRVEEIDFSRTDRSDSPTLCLTLDSMEGRP